MKRIISALAVLVTAATLSACQTTGEGVAWDLVPSKNQAVSTGPNGEKFPVHALCRAGVKGFIQAGNECLPFTEVAADLGSCDTVTGYVFVHGDDGIGDKWVNKFFRYMNTERTPCAQYFTMARPGYPLMDGRQGSGDQRYRIGSTQVGSTPEKVYAVAMLLQSLKQKHPEIKTWSIIGSSSGSNIGGRILGQYPGLAQGGFLLSGNFDLQAWLDMHPEYTATSIGNSLPAIDVVRNVPKDAVIFALTGTSDSNTDISLAESYGDALTSAGVQHVRVGTFAGGHNLVLGRLDNPTTQKVAGYLTEYDQLLRKVAQDQASQQAANK